MASNREQLSIPIDAPLRHAIELAAERDRRPVASLVRVILADWIERDQQQAGERAA